MPLVRKFLDEEQIVTGEVYAPGVMDSHGDTMTAKEIEQMCHRFMRLSLDKSIDANHDNKPRLAHPIESFIARAGDQDFTPGAWVLSVKIDDPEIWAQVKSGEVNGFSFEAYIHKSTQIVAVETVPFMVARTEPDAVDGHTHLFAVRVDSDGKIVEGRTSTEYGHSHSIIAGTATSPAMVDGREHSHRIFT